MKTWKTSQKLEKLASFEPHLISYEFSCPCVYRIEKRISLNSITDEFFTVWWPNDGQVVWQPKFNDNTETETFSLLERDDLRNNVLLMSMQTKDKNLLEHVFKSNGLLLSCSYLTQNSLIVVEQTETSTQKYSINFYRYDLPIELRQGYSDQVNRLAQAQKSLKIKLTSFSLNSKVFSIEQVIKNILNYY